MRCASLFDGTIPKGRLNHKVQSEHCQGANRYGQDAPQGRLAAKNLCDLWKAICMAQEVGGRLGRGALLLRSVPQQAIIRKSANWSEKLTTLVAYRKLLS